MTTPLSIMGLAKDIPYFIFSLICGILGVAGPPTMTIFLLNIIIPITVDHSPSWHNPPRLITWPLLNNILLLLSFGFQHSSMVRGPVKKFLRLFFSEDYYKSLYVGYSGLHLLGVLYLWTPMPYLLWDVQNTLIRLIINILINVDLTMLMLTIIYFDPFELFALQRALDRLFKREKKKNEVKLITTGLYKMTRHPMYTFLFIGFWLAPTMSIGRALFCGVMTTYVLFAVEFYEEPLLVEIFGQQYVDYMKTTPRYIPNIMPLIGKKTD